MPGIMDFFKAAPPQRAEVSKSPPPQGSSDGKPPASGAVGPDGKMPGSNQEPLNPLDAYAKLFDNATTGTPDAPPSFTLDPKLLSEVSGQLNFTQGISPELLTKATSGDTAALLEVINQVGQQSYKTALHHSTTLTDKFVGARSSFDQKNIGSHVQGALTDSALASIPNASHPVVKNQLKMVADMMRKSNPDATPQQIAEASQKYILELAGALNPSDKAKPDESQGEFDWESFITSKPAS